MGTNFSSGILPYASYSNAIQFAGRSEKAAKRENQAKFDEAMAWFPKAIRKNQFQVKITKGRQDPIEATVTFTPGNAEPRTYSARLTLVRQDGREEDLLRLMNLLSPSERITYSKQVFYPATFEGEWGAAFWNGRQQSLLYQNGEEPPLEHNRSFWGEDKYATAMNVLIADIEAKSKQAINA